MISARESLASFTFRNGKSARNRIVVPAMASQTSSSEGTATETTVAHYRRLAASGAGIVIAEYAFVHCSGRAEPQQLGLASDEHEQAVGAIAKVIHEAGALAGFQLVHAGGKSATELTAGPLMGPSAVAVPVKGREMETPRSMTLQDVNAWKEWFVVAAQRAVRAGFDLVEIHAAHGYGLSQWISPLTNRREDGYGGTSEGRFRLLLEIVSALREALPQVILCVRMPGRDFLEGGLEIAETTELAKALEQKGVDLLSISSGIGGWRNPASRNEEGFLVPEAEQIQGAVQIPVIGVGGIRSLGYVDESLRQKRFQFAAVGRAILNEKWPEEGAS